MIARSIVIVLAGSAAAFLATARAQPAGPPIRVDFEKSDTVFTYEPPRATPYTPGPVVRVSFEKSDTVFTHEPPRATPYTAGPAIRVNFEKSDTVFVPTR
ncbi:MAG: hypothetical protein SFX73_01025 [Kofleriaceae bacterium]|nr:hypothetical protein [Kofleriaceae bacterium]